MRSSITKDQQLQKQRIRGQQVISDQPPADSYEKELFSTHPVLPTRRVLIPDFITRSTQPFLQGSLRKQPRSNQANAQDRSVWFKNGRGLSPSRVRRVAATLAAPSRIPGGAGGPAGGVSRLVGDIDDPAWKPKCGSKILNQQRIASIENHNV